MRLQDAALNTMLRVTGVEGESLRKKLTQYGLFEGDCVRVLRAAPLNGPLLVDLNGRTLALGRRVAKKILVEAVE